jgi:hypothetical protein
MIQKRLLKKQYDGNNSLLQNNAYVNETKPFLLDEINFLSEC